MTKKSADAPGLPDLIRHTFKTAAVAGPEQREAIELLQSFGFDPKTPIDQLSDEYVFAVLNRAAKDQTH